MHLVKFLFQSVVNLRVQKISPESEERCNCLLLYSKWCGELVALWRKRRHRQEFPQFYSITQGLCAVNAQEGRLGKAMTVSLSYYVYLCARVCTWVDALITVRCYRTWSEAIVYQLVFLLYSNYYSGMEGQPVTLQNITFNHALVSISVSSEMHPNWGNI